uniref:SGNH hydrolase-type esterase domain-containing protein n=1 Tax=Kryptolebias marmoratus TaxID=37003 RepID=A0A3Q3B723_KRYMA
MPEVLIVGNSAVSGIDHLCNKNKTKVLCFPKDTMSDVTEKIVPPTTDHPSIENFIIYNGANDLAKKQSEIPKKDFSHLLSTLGNLKMKVLISGPIPKPRHGDENYSRLLMINRWLIKECSSKSVNFIDNHKIFWERRHLYKQDGVAVTAPSIWNKLPENCKTAKALNSFKSRLQSRLFRAAFD